MKFLCTKENLLKSLEQVTALASKQTNLPILSHILITVKETQVHIAATNLEIAIKSSFRAKVETEGSFAIPAKTFTEFISLVNSEQITIEKKENEIFIHAQTSKTSIKGMSSEEYPIIPEIGEGIECAVYVDIFKQALADTVIAASKTDIRPELSGVYFQFKNEPEQTLTLAATDSYRLAEVKLSLANKTPHLDCIVPSKTVFEMMRLFSSYKDIQKQAEVKLIIQEGQLGIVYENFQLVSRLISGKYPDYTQLIPTSFKTTTTLSITEFQNHIKAASLFSTSHVSGVSFIFDPEKNLINIASASSHMGEHQSTFETVVQGDKNTIVLNYRYLLEGISHIKGDKVEFSMNGPQMPCLLKGVTDSYSYLIMPILQ